MQIDTVRKMLCIPREQDSWEFIRDNRSDFLWDENGEALSRWNETSAKIYCLGEVSTVWGDDDSLLLKQNQKFVPVPLEKDSLDDFRMIHSLATLVGAESEIRYCTDSWHSSCRAFVALPPKDWEHLEAEFGRDLVTYRFLPISAGLKDFLEEAFSDELQQRSYNQQSIDPSPTKGPWWKFW
ncbi:hypothetical protein FDZ73_20480 [bacterium]|nr:MAG: hypothetical protein FDZ73_20480 [bacterium]